MKRYEKSLFSISLYVRMCNDKFAIILRKRRTRMMKHERDSMRFVMRSVISLRQVPSPNAVAEQS